MVRDYCEICKSTANVRECIVPICKNSVCHKCWIMCKLCHTVRCRSDCVACECGHQACFYCDTVDYCSNHGCPAIICNFCLKSCGNPHNSGNIRSYPKYCKDCENL